MGDVSAIYEQGDAVPYTVGATAVVGGNVVMLSVAGVIGSVPSGAGAVVAGTNGSVIPSTGATNLVVGVAAHDAAIGTRVTVITGGIQELISGAAVAIGPVKSAAGGKVINYVDGTDPAGQCIGVAISITGATDLPVRVRLFR